MKTRDAVRALLLAGLLLAAVPQGAAQTPEAGFLQAVSAGREAEVGRMLESAPQLAFAKDSRGISALMLALYGQHTPVVNLIVAHRQNQLSVFEAAALGNDAVLRALLRQDPSRAREFGPDGFTALHLASYFGHPSSQQLLLQAGADVNAYSRNRFHAAPLQSAAAARQLEAARVLLAHGANPACDGEGGYTPLHEAAATGQVELVRLLLQYKADVAAQGKDGKTPLDLAIQEKQSAVVTLLKEAKGL